MKSGKFRQKVERPDKKWRVKTNSGEVRQKVKGKEKIKGQTKKRRGKVKNRGCRQKMEGPEKRVFNVNVNIFLFGLLDFKFIFNDLYL